MFDIVILLSKNLHSNVYISMGLLYYGVTETFAFKSLFIYLGADDIYNLA